MIKKISIYIVILGAIGFSLNLLFGANTISYIHTSTNSLTGVKYYTIDFFNYLANIQETFREIDQLSFSAPTRQWTTDLINNLKVIADYLIMIINISLYPLRFAAYTTRLVLTVVGVDLHNYQASEIKWLIIFINTLPGGIIYI